MIDPECDNCGRDLDEDDLQNGSCVCGCALPYETRVALEKKYGPSGKDVPSDKDKVIAKVLRARQKPLRRCLTYHHCFYCDQPIFLGETYYDGGYNNRIHESCCAKASNEMLKDYTNANS